MIIDPIGFKRAMLDAKHEYEVDMERSGWQPSPPIRAATAGMTPAAAGAAGGGGGRGPASAASSASGAGRTIGTSAAASASPAPDRRRPSPAHQAIGATGKSGRCHSDAGEPGGPPLTAVASHPRSTRPRRRPARTPLGGRVQLRGRQRRMSHHRRSWRTGDAGGGYEYAGPPSIRCPVDLERILPCRDRRGDHAARRVFRARVRACARGLPAGRWPGEAVRAPDDQSDRPFRARSAACSSHSRSSGRRHPAGLSGSAGPNRRRSTR